jgi:DNA repair protein RadC
MGRAVRSKSFELPADVRALNEQQALFVMDYARRAFEQVLCPEREIISSWSALLAYAKLTMGGASREQFRVLYLDKKNRLMLDEVMQTGTVDHAPVYPREVARRALEVECSAVILLHNHPSGDPAPSGADCSMTRQIVDALRVFGIAVHDHLVVGRDGVASFKALGLI